MGLFSGKKARNRRFEYEPRFYDPSKDERLKQRMRIKSKVKSRGKNQGVLTLGILVVIVILIYLSI